MVRALIRKPSFERVHREYLEMLGHKALEVNAGRKENKVYREFKECKVNAVHKANKALRVKREWSATKVFKVHKEKKGIREIPVQRAQRAQRARRVRLGQWGHLALPEHFLVQDS